jgi:hypothetical protein
MPRNNKSETEVSLFQKTKKKEIEVSKLNFINCYDSK